MKKEVKLNDRDLWIIYKLLNNHLNELSSLTNDIGIYVHPEKEDTMYSYIHRVEKVEKKIEKLRG